MTTPVYPKEWLAHCTKSEIDYIRERHATEREVGDVVRRLAKYDKAFKEFPSEFPDISSKVAWSFQWESGGKTYKQWKAAHKYDQALKKVTREEKSAKGAAKLLAALKKKRLEAAPFAKELGEFLLGEDTPVVGKKAREEKAAKEVFDKKVKSHAGVWVTTVGPGISKADGKMFTRPIWVVKKGETMMQLGADTAVRHTPDGDEKVVCFQVPKGSGIRVLKTKGDLAGWLNDHKDTYLVRSEPGYTDAWEDRLQEARDDKEAVLNPGKTPSEVAAEGKSKQKQRVQGKYEPRARIDEVTGQWLMPWETGSPPRLCIEVAPFRALLTEDQQYEVISDGKLIGHILKHLMSMLGGLAGGLVSHETPEIVEGLKQGGEMWENAESVAEVINWGKADKAYQGKAGDYTALHFSHGGGHLTRMDKSFPVFVELNDMVTFRNTHYPAIKISDIMDRIKI